MSPPPAISFQVPELVRHEIVHFFQIYKDLEAGKSTTVEGWATRASAEAEIRRARKRHAGNVG